jgi:hypothetical protein
VAELEAQEPVAWMHETRVDVIHDSVKTLLKTLSEGAGPESLHRPIDKSERYTIPLYAGPVPAAQAVAGQHADDVAVDRFAEAMKAKMAASRAKGRGGWESTEVCPPGSLQLMMLEHIAKGDPVDVGNFAMMLFCRGDKTTAPGLGSNLARAVLDLNRGWNECLPHPELAERLDLCRQFANEILSGSTAASAEPVCRTCGGSGMKMSAYDKAVPCDHVTASAEVPAEVMAALDRMCTPLDESVLKGATAQADAHSMGIIRKHILRNQHEFSTPDCPDCGCVQDGQCLCTPSKPPAGAAAAAASAEVPEDVRRDAEIARIADEMQSECVAGAPYRSAYVPHYTVLGWVERIRNVLAAKQEGK